ncbi:MAG TPA: hypothetical protein VN366_01760 [Feifaniaceae bacterium]|nr:hypothetical protein [Feifaniaceae bacterium]
MEEVPVIIKPMAAMVGLAVAGPALGAAGMAHMVVAAVVGEAQPPLLLLAATVAFGAAVAGPVALAKRPWAAQAA